MGRRNNSYPVVVFHGRTVPPANSNLSGFRVVPHKSATRNEIRYLCEGKYPNNATEASIRSVLELELEVANGTNVLITDPGLRKRCIDAAINWPKREDTNPNPSGWYSTHFTTSTSVFWADSVAGSSWIPVVPTGRSGHSVVADSSWTPAAPIGRSGHSVVADAPAARTVPTPVRAEPEVVI